MIDPWSVLDELQSSPRDHVGGNRDVDLGPVAFYGRCSTEDHQDPKTSRAWQHSNAAKFVEPLGGAIVEEYFDAGQSRSVAWDRRREGARLLAGLKDPGRSWSAVVVGEGTRCWFGSQFSLMAPRFAAYGVDLWIPELGGRYDERNPSHKMLMSVLGGMSESERQHVQARVRAAMDAQVVNDGRHQGGRAPYGYTATDGELHPNPRKAAEGVRLRVLEIDKSSAEVVRRIFGEYLDGSGDRAIATGLNRDGVPCPSARRPDQNRHRQADGWQAATVRAILENPRYTGYAVFGRWTKYEELLNPDDVGAGHVVRFRRSTSERVVRSRTPAHPAIVSVETFTEVQLLRRRKAAGGLRSRAKLERGPRRTGRLYMLRGRVRCGYCQRRMEGTSRRDRAYYRCVARSITPGTPVLDTHPPTVYIPEAAVLGLADPWIGSVADPAHRDRTVQQLLGGTAGQAEKRRAAAEQALAEAETTLRHLQAAIEAGAAPAALVDPLNRAHEQVVAARVERDRALVTGRIELAHLDEVLGLLGQVGAELQSATPERRTELYALLDLQMTYHPTDRVLAMRINPRQGRDLVRGQTLLQCSQRLTAGEKPARRR